MQCSKYDRELNRKNQSKCDLISVITIFLIYEIRSRQIILSDTWEDRKKQLIIIVKNSTKFESSDLFISKNIYILILSN